MPNAPITNHFREQFNFSKNSQSGVIMYQYQTGNCLIIVISNAIESVLHFRKYNQF